MKTVLYVPYFRTASPRRQAELDLCIKRNLEIDALSTIYLIIDDGAEPPVKDRKLKIISVSSRPTYQHWVEYSYRNDPNSISLLANADIYFKDGFRHIMDSLSQTQSFLALTRYDTKEGKLIPHPNPHWSQDVWGLNTSSALNRELYRELDFMLGVPRCDNKVAYVFSVYGWRILNPMHQVVTVHVHESEERTYNKKTDVRILGGVAYVYPVQEGANSSVLEYDIYARRASKVKDASLSKVIDKLTQDEWVDNQPYFDIKQLLASKVKGAQALSPVRKIEGGVVDVNLVLKKLRAGDCSVRLNSRFEVIREGSVIRWVDGLYAKAKTSTDDCIAGDVSPDDFTENLLINLIPQVFDTWPICFSENGIADDQISFWQYPCTTELQALKNHLSPSKPLKRTDARNRILHMYMGLPWATFVDRKLNPDYLESLFAVRVRGYKKLAQMFAYTLKVHSVCQTIHWLRISPVLESCGVTDLHISHMETDSTNKLPKESQLKLYSWPLIATNVEVPGRSKGLVFGKQPEQKKWLATFTGAHMKHYRSNVRLQLKEAADKANLDDVLVTIKGEWHFNKIVYQEQVAMKPLSDKDIKNEVDATQSYNEMLSDSKFSLCPEGAGPNTLRFWESLAVGSIPVVIADNWVPPEGLTEIDRGGVFVNVPSEKIGELFKKIGAYSNKELRDIQVKAMKVYEVIKDRTCF